MLPDISYPNLFVRAIVKRFGVRYLELGFGLVFVLALALELGVKAAPYEPVVSADPTARQVGPCDAGAVRSAIKRDNGQRMGRERKTKDWGMKETVPCLALSYKILDPPDLRHHITAIGVDLAGIL